MNEPAEVKDVVAENGIRWSIVAQGLILITVAGIGGIGINFGERIITGMEKLNTSLVDIRKEISLANTRGQINGTRLDRHEKDITQNTQDIKDLYFRK